MANRLAPFASLTNATVKLLTALVGQADSPATVSVYSVLRSFRGERVVETERVTGLIKMIYGPIP